MERRYNLAYYLVEGARSIVTHGAMSFAALCMIVSCLLIMGTFSLVAVNVDEMLGALERDNEFIAYVDDSYTAAEAQAIQSKLMATTNVSEATFVSREEAMEKFLSGREQNDLLDSLPADVIQYRYEIRVVDIEKMQSTVTAVEKVTGITDVSAAIEVAEGFVLMRNIATLLALVLVGMLLTVSLFIISNTVRLATFYRRDEIAIMKMCGATDWFIRWPFVVEGMILGLGGALTAFFIQWGLYSGLTSLLDQSGGLSLITVIPFSTMATTIVAVFCGVGFVIGVIGSLVAIRKFLQV